MNTTSIQRYIFCILLIISQIGLSQTPFRLSFRHLTNEEGLSNNNAFHIYKDSRGFTWFSTLNGLTRFDGINCRVFKESNSSIKGIFFYNIIEDKAGNLWVGSDKGINFYDRQRDVFIPIPFGKDSTIVAFPYCVDKQGLIWINIFETAHDGLYTFDVEKRIFQLIATNTSTNFAIPSKAATQEVKSFYCSGANNLGFLKISFKKNKAVKYETFFDGKDNLPAFSYMGDYIFVENDTTIWLTNVQQGLIKFNPKSKKYKSFNDFEGKKIGLLARVIQHKNYLFIGSVNGVYVFDKNKEVFVQIIRHAATNPNGLMNDYVEIPYIDDDGNLFFSQLGPGVDYTNLNRTLVEHWFDSEMVLKMGSSKNTIGNIVSHNDQTWFASEKLFVLDKNGKLIKTLPFENPLLNDSQNRIWATDGKILKWLNPETKQARKYNFKELGKFEAWQISVEEIGKNHFIVSSPKGLFELNDATQTLTPFTEFNKTNWDYINPIYFDKNSQQLFISTNWRSKFLILKKEKNEWRITKNIDKISSVYAIKPAIDTNKLWLCTRNGLIKIDKNSLDYQTFTEKEGLPENFVSDMIELKNGNHWLVTGSGISFYNKSQKKYYNFSSKDGAYSKEYRWGKGFLLSDGRAVFGGTDGITVINPALIKDYDVKPKIQFTKLLINEKQVDNFNYIGENNTIELEANQNSFSLDAVGIEYGFPQKIKINYQLQRIDKQWIMTNNPATIRFSNLPDGRYELWVKATDASGKISSEIRKINVIINAPFYRTVWFRMLLLFTFVALGYLIYRIRTNRIRIDARRTEEIKRVKAEAEISALRSQMNPHFIFNCLNTVDSYILTNKTDEASDFLNKFSKLIRIILENSRQEFIPIEQDLKALELYIKLEKERSFPKFEYEITIDEALQHENYFIPSMLIQPFVENAILHGLRHKKEGGGLIEILIEKIDNQLIILIIDNGIGRANSAKINASKVTNRQSVGIELTTERISRLADVHNGNASLRVKDKNQDTTGTIVEIKLPLLIQEDIKP